MTEISGKIEDKEFLARIILHSFHYSENKNKIRPEAFIPSPSEADEISVLRYDYVDIDYCKCNGLKIAEGRNTSDYPCKFIGIAFLQALDCLALPIEKGPNDEPSVEDGFEMSAIPLATPLCEKNELRTTPPFYTTDKGIPSHGSIKYNVKFYEEAHIPMRQAFKQRIIKPMVSQCSQRFFKDSNLKDETWQGEEIKF